uniref:EF-hand domain-containing protein n=1 Tax=Branchiostoma floridae TaxID=7739 RepID=C3YJD8_BRAFL|eukprot:XP_002603625.1 hypothetical protein BRAFLDRAFT_126931 [Branchiostoma floridae]
MATGLQGVDTLTALPGSFTEVPQHVSRMGLYQRSVSRQNLHLSSSRSSELSGDSLNTLNARWQSMLKAVSPVVSLLKQRAGKLSAVVWFLPKRLETNLTHKSRHGGENSPVMENTRPENAVNEAWLMSGQVTVASDVPSSSRLQRKKSFSSTANVQSFDRDASMRLEDYINLQHLQQLMEKFQVHRPTEQHGNTKIKREAGNMTLDEFKEAVSSTLGTPAWNDQIDALFKKMDTSCDGLIDWNEFCTYMLLQYRENDYMRTKRDIPFRSSAHIKHCVFNKQEPTTKLIYIENPSRYVSFSKLVVLDSIHPEGIRQILYCPHNDVVLSSSGSHSSSVVMMDISRKKKTYVFKVSKGVECFDYNKHMNIIVTGSSDHRVRLWNPYVTSKPITVLSGHHTTIIDVKLFEPMNQVFSYSKDAVVTGSDDSTVAVWDIETGNKSIMFTNAHGDEEITCMTFDTSLRRLITGARDGTIKIWNFQNGHNLHKLEGVGEAEVTGVIPLDSPKVILSVGWSRKIVLYDDSEADNMYVTANTSWKGGQAHSDDILSVAHCPPNLLATASFDGDLIVWSMETQKIFLRLQKGHHSRNPTPVDQLLFLPKRAAGRPSDCALLISSEAGTINWWCIYGTKHHMGYFYAPDIEEESVLGLASSPDNNVLVTGDTMGYIAVWDITEYCVKMRDNMRRVKSRPPRLAYWRAHHSAIVSVEYVDHEVRPFVVSAGTDKTARLWTIEGQYVGTFGQDDDSASDPAAQQVSGDKHDSDNLGQAAEASDTTPEENEPLEAELMFVDGEDREAEEEGDAVAQLPVLPVSRGVPATAQPIKRLLTSQSDDIAVRGLRGRAHTFSTLKYMTRSQSFVMPMTLLGHRVEENLHRKIFTRQERRSHYGDINVKATAPLGTQCSPFQALSMPELQQVYLPSSLPMSPRMVSRGMAATTESELGDLPLAVTPVPEDNDFESVDRSSVSQGSKKWTAGRKVASLNKLNKLPAIKSMK